MQTVIEQEELPEVVDDSDSINPRDFAERLLSLLVRGRVTPLEALTAIVGQQLIEALAPASFDRIDDIDTAMREFSKSIRAAAIARRETRRPHDGDQARRQRRLQAICSRSQSLFRSALDRLPDNDGGHGGPADQTDTDVVDVAFTDIKESR